jgi:hypothetical protein
MIEQLKIKFFIELAEKNPDELDPEKESMLLSIARDGDIIRILKDELIRIQVGNEPAQGD